MDPASWPCWLTFCTRTSDICTSSVSLGFFFFFYSGKQPKCEGLQPPAVESGRVNICGNEKMMEHKVFKKWHWSCCSASLGCAWKKLHHDSWQKSKYLILCQSLAFLALYFCVSCVHASAVCFQQHVFLWLGKDVAHIYWWIRVSALRCRCEFYTDTWNLSREKDEGSRDYWKHWFNRLVV